MSKNGKIKMSTKTTANQTSKSTNLLDILKSHKPTETFAKAISTSKFDIRLLGELPSDESLVSIFEDIKYGEELLGYSNLSDQFDIIVTSTFSTVNDSLMNGTKYKYKAFDKKIELFIRSLEDCMNSCTGKEIAGSLGDFSKTLTGKKISDILDHLKIEEVSDRFFILELLGVRTLLIKTIDPKRNTEETSNNETTSSFKPKCGIKVNDETKQMLIEEGLLEPASDVTTNARVNNSQATNEKGGISMKNINKLMEQVNNEDLLAVIDMIGNMTNNYDEADEEAFIKIARPLISSSFDTVLAMIEFVVNEVLDNDSSNLLTAMDVISNTIDNKNIDSAVLSTTALLASMIDELNIDFEDDNKVIFTKLVNVISSVINSRSVDTCIDLILVGIKCYTAYINNDTDIIKATITKFLDTINVAETTKETDNNSMSYETFVEAKQIINDIGDLMNSPHDADFKDKTNELMNRAKDILGINDTTKSTPKPQQKTEEKAKVYDFTKDTSKSTSKPQQKPVVNTFKPVYHNDSKSMDIEKTYEQNFAHISDADERAKAIALAFMI